MTRKELEQHLLEQYLAERYPKPVVSESLLWIGMFCFALALMLLGWLLS